MYIDGLLAAQAPGLGGTVADGGDPIQLNTADIFLCSRADGNPARHFTGSITHLALWNGALSASQVMKYLCMLSPALGCVYICPCQP